jgi:hypothetical protein
MHPFAFPGNKTGGNSGSKFEICSGDRVIWDIDGRTGVLDECLQGGEAYVTWDDGTYDIVKWNNLSPEKKIK